MTKQKVSELPKEEKEALIEEAKKLGITGVFESFNVETLKAKIEEMKKETEVDEDEDEDSDETDTNEEQEEKNPPEVVAETKEEKRLLVEKNANIKAIEELKEKNQSLEKEIERFDHLSSTLEYQPFLELKSIVSSALQEFAKRQKIKECKKQLKNYEAINSMEELLIEFKEKADEYRLNIKSNETDISRYEDKIAEIDEKLHFFQKKLNV